MISIALSKLKAVLCDPEGYVVITGSQADRAEVQEALNILDRLEAQESREAEPYGYIERIKLTDNSRAQVIFKDPADNIDSVPLYTSKQALSAEVDKIELSGAVEALIDERAEAAYWQFDAAHKGIGEWKDRPQSERDAFKSQFRKYMRAERQSAKMMLRIQKSEQAP